MRSRLFLCASLLTLFAACGGGVESEDSGTGTGTGAKGGGGKGGAAGKGGDAGKGGRECYDACVAKGESAEVCEKICLGGEGGKGSGTGGGPAIECYEACIDKGAPLEVCKEACDDPPGTGGAGFGGTGSGGTGTAGEGGEGGKIDPSVEKPCVECLSDQTAACGDQLKACEQSLACQQLQWCPTLCGKPSCLEECNEIIPTGVQPLRDLVQCAACGEAAPCASECAGALLLDYCE